MAHQEADTSRASERRPRPLLLLLVWLAVPVLLLLLVEGAASYLLLVRETARHPLGALHEHTRYDPELGWVAIPQLDVSDMYGAGTTFRTNSRGFRNEAEVEPRRPAGTHRIVCSGDSVTLGQGVSNDRTWCHLLAVDRPGIEAVNMGQVGYGIDQAYLWYLRDAADLDVDVHVFAFITHDFLRMLSDRFIGFGRPVLEVVDGELVATNTPVPQRAYYVPWLTLLVSRLQMLSTVELAQRVTERIGRGDSGSEIQGASRTPEEVEDVLSVLFESLRRYNDERSRATLLVFIPSLDEIGADPSQRDQWDRWLRFSRERAEALGVPFVDLFEAFSAFPAMEARSLFLDGYHLTDEGNRRAAEAIGARLLAEPSLAQKLGLDGAASASR